MEKNMTNYKEEYKGLIDIIKSYPMEEVEFTSTELKDENKMFDFLDGKLVLISTLGEPIFRYIKDYKVEEILEPLTNPYGFLVEGELKYRYKYKTIFIPDYFWKLWSLLDVNFNNFINFAEKNCSKGVMPSFEQFMETAKPDFDFAQFNCAWQHYLASLKEYAELEEKQTVKILTRFNGQEFAKRNISY